MSDERTCIACAHCIHKQEHGADWLTCEHSMADKPAPEVPHIQRTKPADADRNVCGAEGIFWKARA